MQTSKYELNNINKKTNQIFQPPLQLNKGIHKRPCWCISDGRVCLVCSHKHNNEVNVLSECASVSANVNEDAR